jgi:pimeloyl-ACP methyl ester carboxylesterase
MTYRRVDLPRSGLGARLRSRDERIAGETTVVFVHGLACSVGLWPLREPLPPGLAAVYLDLPGHGNARVQLEGSVLEIAERLKLALDELCVGPVYLVGHSLGGLLALHLEALLGEQALRTLVFCVGARFANIAKALEAMRSDGPTWADRAIAPYLPSGPGFSALRRIVVANARALGRGTWIAGLEALEHYDALLELPPLRRIPRVLVYGSHDPMVQSGQAVRLARWLPATAVKLEGAGHFPMLEQPQAFRELLRQTLEPARSWRARGIQALGPGAES